MALLIFCMLLAFMSWFFLYQMKSICLSGHHDGFMHGLNTLLYEHFLTNRCRPQYLGDVYIFIYGFVVNCYWLLFYVLHVSWSSDLHCHINTISTHQTKKSLRCKFLAWFSLYFCFFRCLYDVWNYLRCILCYMYVYIQVFRMQDVVMKKVFLVKVDICWL